MPTDRPPCFTGIWRDCVHDKGFFEFADGSLYEYPGGAAVATTCANRILRGVTYNMPGNRRPPLGFRAYAKIGGLPDDVEQLFPGEPPDGEKDFPPCTTTIDWSDFGGRSCPDDEPYMEGAATAQSVTVTMNGTSTGEEVGCNLHAVIKQSVAVNVHWRWAGELTGEDSFTDFCMSYADDVSCTLLSDGDNPFSFDGPGTFEFEGDFTMGATTAAGDEIAVQSIVLATGLDAATVVATLTLTVTEL
jgi:hypothetical protein